MYNVEFARTRGARDKKKRKKKIIIGLGASAISTGSYVAGDRIGLAKQNKLKKEYLSLARSSSRTDRRMAAKVRNEGLDRVVEDFSKMYRSPFKEVYKETTKTKFQGLEVAVTKNKANRQKLIKNIRNARLKGRIAGKATGTLLALGTVASLGALEFRNKKRK
jgi:hypothetical protein